MSGLTGEELLQKFLFSLLMMPTRQFAVAGEESSILILDRDVFWKLRFILAVSTQDCGVALRPETNELIGGQRFLGRQEHSNSFDARVDVSSRNALTAFIAETMLRKFRERGGSYSDDAP